MGHGWNITLSLSLVQDRDGDVPFQIIFFSKLLGCLILITFLDIGTRYNFFITVAEFHSGHCDRATAKLRVAKPVRSEESR